ncbi:L,D-transpeptidase family protein [Bowmanella yangjiangensis]|uniref:YkuD domain-containing protein n=1 Tax=Bowmanella yangjiangensis TaxID=2811230 RepID=A0ABS3D066_9ALTE|nr:L,D-transpeptidase family protein [Bowmanella yangjiangensis]MBN7821259.1 hypothetical protein [Bowmanella yangjiangensis]
MKHYKKLIPLAALLACNVALANWQVPSDVEQLVVVTTKDWQAIQGQMQVYERQDGQWQAADIKTPVTIGRTGMAWGIGLHPQQPGQQKQEGDGKAPAGVFRLTTAFGYQALNNLHLPYEQMQSSHYCMDVNGSPYYNQIVDSQKVGEKAVEGSTEGMRRDLHNGDDLYKKGIVVEHNGGNISGAGSCIFMHLWRAKDKPTAGCTAMPEGAMDKLLGWLEAEKHPALLLLPEDEYQKLRSEWALP